MSEEAKEYTNPQAESALDKMARGMTEETGARGDIQEGIQGSPQERDALPLIEGKINEMAQGMTEDTGSHGAIFVHTERRMDKMAQKIFKED